MANQE